MQLWYLLHFYNDFLTQVNKAIFCLFNRYHATGLFLCPLKISENLWFSDVFGGYRKRPVAWNGLNAPRNRNIYLDCSSVFLNQSKCIRKIIFSSYAALILYFSYVSHFFLSYHDVTWVISLSYHEKAFLLLHLVLSKTILSLQLSWHPPKQANLGYFLRWGIHLDTPFNELCRVIWISRITSQNSVWSERLN